MIYFITLLMITINKNPTLIENNDALYMQNEKMAVSILKGSGNLEVLSINNVDLLSDMSAVQIITHPEYDEVKFTQVKSGNTNLTQRQITIKKESSSIICTQVFTMDSICLRWEIEIENKSGVQRESEISLLLPIIGKMNNYFSPTAHGPDTIMGIPVKPFVYRRNLTIPLLTLYNTYSNIGLSIVPLFEFPKPKLTMTIDPPNIIILFKNLMLDGRGRVKIGLYLAPHKGDWRPGLEFILNRYPQYFYPAIENTKIGEGYYYLSLPYENEINIENLKTYGVRWTEIHHHFPFYGLYAPDLKRWNSNIDTDTIPIIIREKGMGKKTIGYQTINDLIDIWHKNEIQTYLYFQAFEAWHQYAEKYFISDIARDRSGINLPAWQYCTLMNPDPATPWGKYILIQAEKIIKKYPDADGVFYDRMDYMDYDFSHQDGITMIDGKPAYTLGFALEKMNDTIFNIFHRNKKGIWGNGPSSIEVCKDLDGIMTEGGYKNLYRSQYMALTRPIIYLPYDIVPDATEEKLKNCLLCGAFPSVTYGDSICRKLDEKYRPLFDVLKGRTWVLSPNPITISDKHQANIFRTSSGDYAAVIISPEKSQLYNSFEYNLPVTVTLPDANKITAAYLISGDWTGIHELKLKRTKTHIDLTIPYHLTNSMILLTKGKRYPIAGVAAAPLLTLEDISITPPKDVFIRSREFETVPIEVTNNTERKTSLQLTAEAINNSGMIRIPKIMGLKPLETKIVDAQIKTAGAGSYRITVLSDRRTYSRTFSIQTGLSTQPGDLLYDDFSQGMKDWTIDRGAWKTDRNIAEGSGPSHLAYILNNQWHNYQYQVTTRIKGSDDPEVDWLKSYIFFRLQDARNFYRFGIHGDGGVIDLFKCINGEWIQIGSANLIPLPETWYTMLVTVRGDAITGYIDGKKMIEARDSTFPAGGIGIGVLEDAMRVEYKDIILRQLN